MINDKILLELINCAMYKKTWNIESDDEITQEEWITLYKRIGKNTLMCFLYDTVNEYLNRTNTQIDVYDEWTNYSKAYQIREIQKYIQMRKIINAARKENIELIFFKGAVIADLYPNYLQRNSSDSDIWVSDKQCEAAKQLFINLGYWRNEEHSKPGVDVFVNDTFGHVVELHTRLWEDYTGKRIDILAKENLTDPATFINMNVCGVECRTLGFTEHFIFQMFHIIKHFSLQGVGLRYLVDTVYFVNKYSNEIDWNRFKKCMDNMGYRKFCDYFFTLGIDYLGMDKNFGYGEIPKIDEKILWEFVNDLTRIGSLDDSDSMNWQIFGAMTPYFTGESSAPKNGKLSYIFPGRESLPNNYAYAKKLPILLPVAWIHRFILFGVNRFSDRENTYNATEKLQVTEYRLRMLDNMGLMEE